MSEFVTERSVMERKLSQRNVYKVPGSEGLPNWILRDFCTELSGPACTIFNASVREGTMPARWKPAAHPPQLIESDLHPISLTVTLSNLLESFVGSWILNRIQDKLDVHQYGALKGRSTTHGLVDMLHQWHKAVNEGQAVRTVSLTLPRCSTMLTTTS